MRRATRSGREYGAGPALVPDMSADAGIRAPSSKARRPLLRGWVHLAAVPYTILLTHRLVVQAPSLHVAYATIAGCFCLATQYVISAYYHAVTHETEWRAYVRTFDHAGIFLSIFGTYMPFLVVAYEKLQDVRVLYVLAAMGCITLVGVLMSVLQLSGKLKKIHRVLLYAVIAWLGVPVVATGVFEWNVYMCLLLGGICYTAGGLAYAKHWPDVVPGVFGYHEVFHVATVVANTLLMRGLEYSFAQ
jgi:hemolysin III